MEIKFENVTKYYGRLNAVENFSLVIPEKKFLAVVGPSGCGKTTLLGLLAGLLAPDEGKIYLNGQLASDRKIKIPPQNRQIGMVFQSLALWPHMTVAKNLEFVLQKKRYPKTTRPVKINEMLDLMQLTPYARKYPGQLSEGERQRVALARALIVEPAIFLLDEPLSNLDRTLAEKMLAEISGYHQKFGTTTVYVTHDQSEALGWADLVAVMNQGQLVQTGTPEEVYRCPKNKLAASFIGTGTVLPAELIDAEPACQSETADRQARTELGDLACRINRPPADKKIFVLIRPENIILIPGGPLQGLVVHNKFQGERWLIKINLASSTTLYAYAGEPVPLNTLVSFKIVKQLWGMRQQNDRI